MSPGNRLPGGGFAPDDDDPARPSIGSGTTTVVSRDVLLERKYKQTEERALDVIDVFLRSDGDDQKLLKRAKVAQAALGHVQSHNRNELGRRALDFELARALTRDPGQLEHYIRTTQHDSPAVALLPKKAEG